jgi:hypothetical protein
VWIAYVARDGESRIDGFDTASRRRAGLPAVKSGAALNLARTPPPGDTLIHAWQPEYPRFEGVDYNQFDEYASTLHNEQYALVFRQGLEASNCFGVLYLVNKANGTARAIGGADAMYEFQVADGLLFYLAQNDPARTLTIYDVDSLSVVDEVTDVETFGFPQP